MVTISEAHLEMHFKEIQRLASSIWKAHYTPIIGEEQVLYMLDKFQSAKAIESQIKGGFKYYILSFENLPVGYLAIKKEEDSLFLSKIYVLDKYRGQKIGKKAMAFITEKAYHYKLSKIRLTVNVNNINAILAYKKMGFLNNGPLVTDIGNGYIMDDYEMIKQIN
ncbi:GNAT family N-acetyltransferase [Cognatitamlana onchidii]|uniref:GNAT family N-acetyltransferase n=1 Tax=Cognatitamlana onchidii TaxID=2562860 RepID=UPI0010A63371|nr:GNAT family N-acetyltransferase [Algibacter onchidii]